MIFVGVSEVREVMNFEYKNNNFDIQEFFMVRAVKFVSEKFVNGKFVKEKFVNLSYPNLT
jgi:hypothetical protein